MALVRSEGIVLKTYALGDTSRIVVVYTRDHGLVKMVAKGARKTPSRFGTSLEPLSRARFHYYLKPDRDLHLVSQAEPIESLGMQLSDLARLSHAQAALELVDRLVWGEEPHEALYDLLVEALAALVAAPPGALMPVTLGFQLRFASLLGYRPRLDACASCGAALAPERWFSAARGGLLCAACAPRESGVVRLSADALAALSLLLARPLTEAGSMLEPARTGEVERVVESFLRAHFQRFQGLRSLEVLRSLDSPLAGETSRGLGPGGSVR